MPETLDEGIEGSEGCSWLSLEVEAAWLSAEWLSVVAVAVTASASASLI